MTNTISNSSISLIFNDSWLAHMGSRIYQMAIEPIEILGTAFSHPLVQAHSGKRLYQLVDAYRESRNNKELYHQARFHYAGSIIKALQGEKNPLEKTKRARTILNTHIIGLSILQAKDKKALSQHVAYTLLPSLIDEFGVQMANRSVLALHELDNRDQSKNVNEYAKLYRDITLQQNDLDSFVKALQELNSDVPKDILIHELLLSRNRNLTDAAKDKIISTLKNSHYIDIKVQKKLQLLKQLNNQNKLSESEIALKLASHRDDQVEVIHYMAPSMFFDSMASPITNEFAIDESGDISYESPEAQETTTESSSLEMTAQSRKEPLSLKTPIGISNFGQSCWYNSALQIMNNTPIYGDILQQSNKFSTDFPNIWESLNSYRNSSRLDLDTKMYDIRKEIQDKINRHVQTGSTQEDSKWFLTCLLEKLSIDTYFTMIGNKEDVNDIIQGDENNALNKQAKYLLIEVERTLALDLNLFTNTQYQPYGIILHDGGSTGGHYTAAVRKEKSWYICDDSYVRKVQETEINNILQNNTTQAFLIASRKN